MLSTKKFFSSVKINTLVSRYFRIRRMMKSEHISKTADSSRNEIVSLATVVGLRDETKTVKSVTLKVEDRRLIFKAGQWIDMFIPGVETVGGFSMCSSPSKLLKEQCMDLAVKYSKHPPAHWIHTQCKEGDQVNIRVGGDFSFDAAVHKDVDLLLVAGGVGINPLYSIINELADLNQGDNANKFTGRVILLYSARTVDELAFKEQLNEIHSNNENIMCQFHVTREGDIYTRIGNVFLLGQRVEKGALSTCFDWLRKEKIQVYICGPSHMIEDVENTLLGLNVDKSCIRYEKWW
ncbi:oxidoreductase NAD-binding domain-containing protein 1-like isoform X2 [Mercenaria mercenaria]|uniref:oxidoreductase NAD-binding domain-containing protein 1-like isoform X2 n=1 Tax=Mercenaria mercenaria TaxID=6596 RepID=UPI00234F9A7B|nr:oxidoreductase NAD-binding domain-containing protein 1-like isoform X2 [Mercenaria mercenaria]